jgi:Fe2+ transport system protein FeoA
MSERAGAPLTSLRPGRPARIVQLPAGPCRTRLANLGAVPGAPIEVLQLSPAVVARVGATTLALEAAVASEIQVEPGDR